MVGSQGAERVFYGNSFVSGQPTIVMAVEQDDRRQRNGLLGDDLVVRRSISEHEFEPIK